jgi:hypothetical protein
MKRFLLWVAVFYVVCCVIALHDKHNPDSRWIPEGFGCLRADGCASGGSVDREEHEERDDHEDRD